MLYEFKKLRFNHCNKVESFIMKERVFARLFMAVLLFASFYFISCNSQQQKDEVNLKGHLVVDSCCNEEGQVDSIAEQITSTLQCEITCPKCGYKKSETMPTDVCLLTYTCKKCHAVLHPKEGDCCVFCTYGNQKCPSMQ